VSADRSEAQYRAHARTDDDRRDIIDYAMSHGVPAAADFADVTRAAVWDWIARLGTGPAPRVVTASAHPHVHCPWCANGAPMDFGNPGSETDRQAALRAHVLAVHAR
jgi:hypothetical protein